MCVNLGCLSFVMDIHLTLKGWTQQKLVLTLLLLLQILFALVNGIGQHDFFYIFAKFKVRVLFCAHVPP
jgi:hypothetical protein